MYCIFNNRIAERLTIVCCFERFHSKQLEYATKDHIDIKQYAQYFGSIL